MYFKTIPTEGKLQSHPRVAFHGRRVMVALSQVFEHLGDWGQTRRLLECLADKHKNTHRVPARAFQVPPPGQPRRQRRPAKAQAGGSPSGPV